MIYSVVPEELAPELYERLVEYYRDDPNVKVIIDRREGKDRRRGKEGPSDNRRQVRDRRQRRAMGSFPPIQPAG